MSAPHAYCDTCGVHVFSGKTRCDACVLASAEGGGVPTSSSMDVASSHSPAADTSAVSCCNGQIKLSAALSLAVLVLAVAALSCAASVFKSTDFYRTSDRVII